MNFAYGFVLYQAILLAIPALIWLAGSSVDGGDLIGGILAGGFQAAGMLTLSLAFQRGNVGLVAPILSLEGVFAAVFALSTARRWRPSARSASSSPPSAPSLSASST